MGAQFVVEVLAKELGSRGVAVNSILPTAIDGAGVFTDGSHRPGPRVRALVPTDGTHGHPRRCRQRRRVPRERPRRLRERPAPVAQRRRSRLTPHLDGLTPPTTARIEESDIQKQDHAPGEPCWVTLANVTLGKTAAAVFPRAGAPDARRSARSPTKTTPTGHDAHDARQAPTTRRSRLLICTEVRTRPWTPSSLRPDGLKYESTKRSTSRSSWPRRTVRTPIPRVRPATRRRPNRRRHRRRNTRTLRHLSRSFRVLAFPIDGDDRRINCTKSRSCPYVIAGRRIHVNR